MRRVTPACTRRLAAIFPQRIGLDIGDGDQAAQDKPPRRRSRSGCRWAHSPWPARTRAADSAPRRSSSACFSRSSRLIAQQLSGMARSITSQIASSAEDSGALAAIFSKTRRSPAAIASARLRSVMSMMLARSRRRLELGRRTNRTSQGKFWPVGIAMHPLEHRHLAGQGALDVAARDAEGRRAVGLQRGTDLVRTAVEQRCAAHLEEAAGVVVDIDELADIDIEYHDHFGSMLHQRAVAPLAFAHRLLRRDAVR